MILVNKLYVCHDGIKTDGLQTQNVAFQIRCVICTYESILRHLTFALQFKRLYRVAVADDIANTDMHFILYTPQRFLHFACECSGLFGRHSHCYTQCAPHVLEAS